ncbi:hypothetical protein SAMN05421837_107612 [Amycolatopsis pretoriensis]|uniref:Uncharacterized protein n=1 Tax=Amycolatopsis pretoriensis TaxID=218821 RepID=A0A1H5R964_9PSEU|nr:hypothetical protein [Amycolatopsis pretoriensis]SEF34859.1 hypothetical protein SAMN05421837_107612 [Amycolatopsis pretoriensis]
MRRKTPQEKKRLSYLKDRRDTYGENAKSTRKNLPRGKAFARRANRARESLALRAATGNPDEVRAEAAELRILGKRRRVKRKWPDTPLAEYVEWKVERRAEREGGRAGRLEEALGRVQRRMGRPDRG